MTTLMSSRVRGSEVLGVFASCDSHERSARVGASPALYQWRLLALTLPTATLLFRTTPDAGWAMGRPLACPPLPDS
jgi:hypothetical protein